MKKATFQVCVSQAPIVGRSEEVATMSVKPTCSSLRCNRKKTGFLLFCLMPVFAFAETYYWTGASGTTALGTAGNWALADGSVPASAPGKNATVVFTNVTALSVTKSADLNYLRYEFKGANVSLPKGSSRRQYGYGGGGIWAAGGGTYTFGYPLELNTAANFAGEDKTFVVDVDASSKVTLNDTGTLKISTPAIFVKKGAGQFTAGGLSAETGSIQLERGEIYLDNDKTLHTLGTLSVCGAEAKKVTSYGSAISILNYSEDSDAVGTLTLAMNGNTRKSTITGTVDTRFSADVVNVGSSTQYYQLEWAPTSECTMNVVGRRYNQPKTEFIVSSGTLRFSEGACAPQLRAVAVKAGATLAIAGDAGTDFSGMPVSLETGATLKVEDSLTKFAPKSVTVGGTALDDGAYRAGDPAYPWLTGHGFLLIGDAEPVTTTATWTANGGSDTSVLNPANWGAADNQELPDLTGGSLVATFPAGNKASFPEGVSYSLKGLVFAAPNDFLIEGAKGVDVLVGSQGITASENAGMVSVSVSLFAFSDQAWSLGNKADSSHFMLMSAGHVRGFRSVTITASGDLEIESANPDFPSLTTTGNVYPHADWALGGSQVTTKISEVGKYVYLYGHSFSNKFLTSASSTDRSKTVLFNLQGGTNCFYGMVSATGLNAVYWSAANTVQSKAGMLQFKGGLSHLASNKSTMMGPRFPCQVSVDTVPFKMTKFFLGYAYGGTHYPVELTLNVSSNETTRGLMSNARGTKIRTTVPYALFASETGSSGVGFQNAGSWDLCGFDQGVNNLWSDSSDTIVRSDAPATLHVRDDRLNEVYQHATEADDAPNLITCKVQVDRVQYDGCVSFSKDGVLDRWMVNESSSTGGVAVTEGRLIFAKASDESVTLGTGKLAYTFKPTTGSWLNAKNVNISGNGKLAIQHEGAFDRNVAFVVTGDEEGRIQIPAGVTVRCSSLTVNERLILNGLVEKGLVSGGGRLQIGKPGLVIIVQ